MFACTFHLFKALLLLFRVLLLFHLALLFGTLQLCNLKGMLPLLFHLCSSFSFSTSMPNLSGPTLLFNFALFCELVNACRGWRSLPTGNEQSRDHLDKKCMLSAWTTLR